MPNSPSPGAARLSRRGALAGIGSVGAALALGGTVLSGCTAKQTRSAADLIASDPLGPLYTETQALITVYDNAIVQAPELVPVIGALREEHRQHLVALASLIGLAAPAVSAGPDTTGSTTAPPDNPTPVTTGSAPVPEPGTTRPVTSAPPATGPATDTRTTLSNAEKTAQQHAVAACLVAPAGRVAVLASITACLATHVAALR